MNAESANRKPRAFLTGGNGFLGPHVIAALHDTGFEVFSSKTLLSERETLRREIESGPRDLIIHMAGVSLPSECEKNPALAYSVNFTGTVTLLELIKAADIHCPFIFFSTAYVYSPDLEGVITEESRTAPAGVYGRSKLAAEECLRASAKAMNLPVLILRLFNHSHKSQRSDFFLPAMYRTLSAAQSQAPQDGTVDVPMGNPNLLRDFSSMQDFRLVMTSLAGNIGSIAKTISTTPNCYKVCNLSSGQARELGSLVHALADTMRLQANLKPQADRMRPGEPEKVSGDPSELQKLLGFSWPKRSDQEFVELFLEDLA